MKKRAVVIALVLLTLIAVGTLYAATGVSISRTNTSLTVKNVTDKTVTGDVCIKLGRTGSNWKGEDWFHFTLGPYKSDTYRTNGDTIITSYSDLVCEVPEE